MNFFNNVRDAVKGACDFNLHKDQPWKLLTLSEAHQLHQNLQIHQANT